MGPRALGRKCQTRTIGRELHSVVQTRGRNDFFLRSGLEGADPPCQIDAPDICITDSLRKRQAARDGHGRRPNTYPST